MRCEGIGADGRCVLQEGDHSSTNSGDSFIFSLARSNRHLGETQDLQIFELANKGAYRELGRIKPARADLTWCGVEGGQDGGLNGGVSMSNRRSFERKRRNHLKELFGFWHSDKSLLLVVMVTMRLLIFKMRRKIGVCSCDPPYFYPQSLHFLFWSFCG